MRDPTLVMKRGSSCTCQAHEVPIEFKEPGPGPGRAVLLDAVATDRGRSSFSCFASEQHDATMATLAAISRLLHLERLCEHPCKYPLLLRKAKKRWEIIASVKRGPWARARLSARVRCQKDLGGVLWRQTVVATW